MPDKAITDSINFNCCAAPAPSVPIAKVILAGDSDPAAAVRAVRERAFSYLHKPLADQPVADLVQQALDSESWQNDLRLVSSRPDWIALDIRCKLSAADRATQFLRELESDLPQHTREDIAAAFRELLLNGIEHGAKGDPKKARPRLDVCAPSAR